MIEPHGGTSPNFARYYGNVVGSPACPNSVFANFWGKMANLYKANSLVLIGLMNEPNNMSTMQWFSAAQDAITAIRSAGFNNIIMVPGNGWSHPSSWHQNWYDTASVKVSNATGYLTLKDPLNNMVATVHTYFDNDSSGSSNLIRSATAGSDSLKTMVAWARSNNVKIHLSEFGAQASQPLASVVCSDLCNYIKSNRDIMLGAAWWVYGSYQWWSAYQFTLAPSNDYKLDSPQWPLIDQFIKI